ncbi:MAG: MbcA/ParS/Xre antitoxin family protein [archaeon]|nr:MbcA/ParS/Xre antitoxin family protein [archaeon]
MKIEDILKEERFKELDLFLTEEMKKFAGNDLIQKMKEVIGEEDARNWFYSPYLGGKRPYDYCKEGNTSEVRDILSRIEYGLSP